ncbi:LANO_0H24718g1_1 [Lachancea nothofagi CBS 11611]|uniref:LANO_0H24718g1_1 n=1 Tax=Lachancea nothofagi CBS 11611 TaxID=1266666 RepID=A0A1G4KP16_9SACH|nr:LANO_0H24718g1_1 [Lachancea nothofagi CBS 11611]
MLLSSFVVGLLVLQAAAVPMKPMKPIYPKQSDPTKHKSSSWDAIGWAETNITTTLFEAGFELIAIPDDVKGMKAPLWLEGGWEDLEFYAKIGTYCPPQYSDSEDLTIKAMAYVFAHASGTWLNMNNSLHKRELGLDINVLADFWDSGLAKGSGDSLRKRDWEKFVGGTWIRSDSNVALVGALDALSEAVQGGCSWIVGTGSTAICAKNGNDQACIAWSGDSKSLQMCAAKQILESCRAEFGEDVDISAQLPGGLEINNENRSDQQVCVSNRPDGC